jgi:hypothetical protein
MNTHGTGYMTVNETTRGFERELYRKKTIEPVNGLVSVGKAPGTVFFVKMQ